MEFGDKIWACAARLLAAQGVANGRVAVVDVAARPNDLNALMALGYEATYLPAGEVATGAGDYDAYLVPELARLGEEVGEPLEALRAAVLKQGVPLVVMARNASHSDHVLRLLAGTTGNRQASLPFAHYTGPYLQSMMEAGGFAQTACEDLKLDADAQYEDDGSLLLQKRVLANEYISWVKSVMDPNAHVYAFVRSYAAAAAPVQPVVREAGGHPFLSVITRTQGKRLPELREVLLCLTGQTDSDFEVLLVGHRVRPENKEKIKTLLAELPLSMQNCVRYLEIDVGNRSAPINYGLAHARGEYFSILDDDDLVLDNWVACFHEAAPRARGTILHAYCVMQEWRRGTLPDALAAMEKTDALYCEPYDYLRQARENHCPTLSLAFPMELYIEAGQRVDETLDTTEDWDFLMRAVLLTGVYDAPEVTAIYRKWGDGDSSYTLHDTKHWMDNYDLVRAGVDSRPFLMPAGGTLQWEKYYYLASERELMLKEHNKMMALYDEVVSAQALLEERHRYFEASAAAVNLQIIGLAQRALQTAVLYVSQDGAFSEQDTVAQQNAACTPKFDFSYQLPTSEKPVCAIRFDPCEQGEVAVRDLCITAVDASGRVQVLEHSAAVTNGHWVGQCLVFLQDDPQIGLEVPVGFEPVEVRISGRLEIPIPPAVRQQLWLQLAGGAQSPQRAGFFHRVARRLKRMLGGRG